MRHESEMPARKSFRKQAKPFAVGFLCWAQLYSGACTPAWPDIPAPPRRPFPPQTLPQSFWALRERAAPAAVQLLSANEDAWAARWDILRNATQRIDLVYFILEDDVFGLSLLGLLHKKALEGVAIQLLLDGRGSSKMTEFWSGRRYLETLVGTQSADIRIYNPPIERTLDSLARLSWVPAASSNHDKIIVVDSYKSIIGGRNIAAGYFANQVAPGTILDSDILIASSQSAKTMELAIAVEYHHRHRKKIRPRARTSPSDADELLLYFHAMDIWLHQNEMSSPESAGTKETEGIRSEMALALEQKSIEALGRIPSRRAQLRFRRRLLDLVTHRHLRGTLPRVFQERHLAPVHVVDTRARPDPREPRLFQAVAHLLESTKASVFIETPYLVLTRGEVETLRRAGERGVSITILTNSPESSDNPLSQAFFLSDWPEVLAAVPNLKLFATGGSALLHSKRIVFDDQITMIGTHNLDPLSDFVNSEVVAVVLSKSFARENAFDLRKRLGQANVFEYRIARNEDGKALRYPAEHPLAGQIRIRFGHLDHCHPDSLTDITRLQGLVGILRTMPAMRPFRHAQGPTHQGARTP